MVFIDEQKSSESETYFDEYSIPSCDIILMFFILKSRCFGETRESDTKEETGALK